MMPTSADKLAATLYASRREKSPYEVVVLNKNFIVFPGVFSPKFCADTAFYAEKLPVWHEDCILEIGCGTGIVSICSLYRGARSAVGIDINPFAVQNSIENAATHNLSDKMQVRLGDVYEALKPDERFNLIFWNIPFGYLGDGIIGLEEMAIFDPGYKAFKTFICESRNYLKESGRLFFGCCPALSRFDLLNEIIDSAGFSYIVSAQFDTRYLGDKISFQLFEARDPLHKPLSGKLK
jgi:16S rRNA G1207 methylase RsmC